MNRRRAAGMTLIEVLVALAVLSLLAGGILSTFRIGQRAYERVVRADRSYWDVVVAQRFIRGRVGSAYPFEPAAGAASRAIGLDGTSERLAVTAPGGLAAHSTGFRRFTFSLVRREDGLQDLVVTSELDRNGRPADDTVETPPGEVVVARVKSAQWSYLDAAGEAADWQSTWTERRAPSLVRLRVEFPPGDGRHWPDLIITPRVTDDANCSFDVVAQACREVQS